MTFLAPASPCFRLEGMAMDLAQRVPHGALVHYISPFDTPKWLSVRQAEEFLEEDELRWSRLEDLGMVSDTQFDAGPPHIDASGEAPGEQGSAR